MATTNSTPTTTVADGLREIADWLDAHPEITPRYAFVPVHAQERDDLERLAGALGDRAAETFTGTGVRISGAFTPDVDVYAEIPIRKLTHHASIRPPYKPILGGQS